RRQTAAARLRQARSADHPENGERAACGQGNGGGVESGSDLNSLSIRLADFARLPVHQIREIIRLYNYYEYHAGGSEAPDVSAKFQETRRGFFWPLPASDIRAAGVARTARRAATARGYGQ